MKILVKLLCICTLLFVGASVSANLWGNPVAEIPYCQGGECSLEGGANIAKTTIEGIESNRSLSEYVIDIVQYLSTFLTLIGVIIVIYAGFMILVSGGDEEKVKSARKIILYVIIGLVLIWLAWSIMTFFVGVLNGDIPDAEVSGP